MEQTYKRTIPSRQADKLTAVKLNLWLNSNCISSANGVFSRIPSSQQGVLGNKKAIVALGND